MKYSLTVSFLGCLLLSSNSFAVEYTALVRAITAVESAGDPLAVGLAGERGLMQLKAGTWRDMTAKAYGRELPFDYAFHSRLNQRMGHNYLKFIAGILEKNNAQLNDGFVSLIIASYNLGPTAVADRGYALHRLPHRTRDYVERVSNMYGYYLSAVTPAPEADALSRLGVAPPLLQAHLTPADESPEFFLRDDLPDERAPAAAQPQPQRAGLSSLLPLFLLAMLWSLYRAHLRSRRLDTWLEEVVSSTNSGSHEFDFGVDTAQA